MVEKPPLLLELSMFVDAVATALGVSADDLLNHDLADILDSLALYELVVTLETLGVTSAEDHLAMVRTIKDVHSMYVNEWLDEQPSDRSPQ